MAKVRKKKKTGTAGTVIYVVILILWILFVAACGMYILKQVWDYASVYDKTVIDPVIEEYFDRLQTNAWSDGMDELVRTMPHPTRTDAEVKDMIQEKLRSETLSYRVKPGFARSDSVTYNLYCGSDIIGEVVLVNDTSKNYAEDIHLPAEVVGVLAKIGVAIQPEIYAWKVESESFNFEDLGLYSSVRITVPSNYTVTVNGVVLGDEYIVERDVEYDVLHYFYYEYEGLPTKVTYQLESNMGDANVVVYDANGQVFVIDENRDDSQFMPPVDDATRASLESFISGFAENYLQMRANTLEPMYAYQLLLPYIKTGTEMDNRLKQATVIDTWSHNSYFQFGGSQILNVYGFRDQLIIVEFHAEASAQQPAGPNVLSSDFRALVDLSGGSPLVISVEDI